MFEKSNDVVVSPLRYPGAKRRFVRLIRETISANGLAPRLFVEPFAGGASVALQLLSDGIVEKVGLAELDPLVASFWKAVFWDTDWLVRRIRETAVTLDLWDRLKTAHLSTDRERAFACLYLNRTSFSGILSPTAGPLGGREQMSAYKLDCRFPRQRLTRRIHRIAQMRSRIAFVKHATWGATLSECLKLGLAADEVFFYLDPPFYFKADRLYAHYFRESDHAELCRTLATLSAPWLLSYDPADAIIELYAQNGARPKHLEVLYSAGSGGSQRREVVITNLKELPVPPGYKTYTPTRSRVAQLDPHSARRGTSVPEH